MVWANLCAQIETNQTSTNREETGNYILVNRRTLPRLVKAILKVLLMTHLDMISY
jgi:hypothetical protein